MISVIYLTRRCPRACSYCGIKESRKTELSTSQWLEAFYILKKIGVQFNLILGNEPWLLGDMPIIVNEHGTPYAVYSSAFMPLFMERRKIFFGEMGLKNFSVGIDYPPQYVESRQGEVTQEEKKSLDAWKALCWIRENYPDVECQGTITIHKKNIWYLKTLMEMLTEKGIWIGANTIHWSFQKEMDFAGEWDHRFALERSTNDLQYLTEMAEKKKYKLHMPEYLQQENQFNLAHRMWHCRGNPYDGPTVDADGTLRCCGYVKGERSSKFSIFDLPHELHEYRKAVMEDALRCRGCFWSCAWGYHFYKKNSPDQLVSIFAEHKRG